MYSNNSYNIFTKSTVNKSTITVDTCTLHRQWAYTQQSPSVDRPGVEIGPHIRVGISTSWLGYELAWYDLVRVRVDWHPGRRSYLGHVPQLRPASTTATCRWLLWKKDVNMLRYKELFSKMENIIKKDTVKAKVC